MIKMKEKYCPKCDTYYQTPEGDKEIDECPFCSLGDYSHDNLDADNWMSVKNVEKRRNKE